MLRLLKPADKIESSAHIIWGEGSNKYGIIDDFEIILNMIENLSNCVEEGDMHRYRFIFTVLENLEILHKSVVNIPVSVCGISGKIVGEAYHLLMMKRLLLDAT